MPRFLLLLSLLLLLGVHAASIVSASPFSEALAFNIALAPQVVSLPQGQEPTTEEMRDMYLSLMSNSVLGLSLPNSEYSLIDGNTDAKFSSVTRLQEELRRNGTDLPFIGISASGERNLQRIRKVLENKYNELKSGEVDVVSCAPFRGGTAVFMRAVLNSLGVYDAARVVVVGANFARDEDDTSRDTKLKASKRGAPGEETLQLSSSAYLALQSSSRAEIQANFGAHFPLVPLGEEDVKIVYGGEDGGVSFLKRKVGLLHIGPASVNDAAHCMSIVAPHLADGAVVIADRCLNDDRCVRSRAGAGLQLDIGEEGLLESGGVMGVVGGKGFGGGGKFRVSNMREAYLLLLKESVLGNALLTSEFSYQWDSTGIATQATHEYRPNERFRGIDWPWLGSTMVGTARLNQLQDILVDVVENNVEGDFVECGSWRGGAAVYARGLLNDMGQQHRRVWVFDSFEGLPPNRTGHDEMFWSQMDYLRVSTDEVWNNFRGHNLANKDNVILDKGFFVDTLPSAPVKKISVLRMDGDMYESTLDTLFGLYGQLSVGGYVIVDDAPRVGPAEKAIRDFCRWHGFEPQIVIVHDSIMGCHWQKKVEVTIQREHYIKILTDPEHIAYQQKLMAREQSCAAGGDGEECISA